MRRHPTLRPSLDDRELTSYGCQITIILMVGSFRHKGLKRMYHGDAKAIEAPLRGRVRQILALLDRTSSPQALALPGLNLHELQGKQRGVWSVG